jgi:hypothetical protein
MTNSPKFRLNEVPTKLSKKTYYVGIYQESLKLDKISSTSAKETKEEAIEALNHYSLVYGNIPLRIETRDYQLIELSE